MGEKTLTKREAFWKRYHRNDRRLIGEGRYGSVCRALDTKTDEVVAIKRIVIEDDESGIPSTSMREITLLKLLHDVPNVVDLKDVLYDYNPQTGSRELNLVLECLSRDLRAYVRSFNDQPIPKNIIKSLMVQMCRGLVGMHKRGIFHRDLKPQNILIDTADPAAPVLKIADLGLGRSHSLPIDALTHEVGSLHYRAPEVLLGAKYYGHAIDTWSVGCIFAELMTRKTLFSGGTEFEQLKAIFEKTGTPRATTFPQIVTFEFWHEFPDWTENKIDQSMPTDINPHALDLLLKLLVVNPVHRIKMVDVMAHPFIIHHHENTLDASSQNSNQSQSSETQVPDG